MHSDVTKQVDVLMQRLYGKVAGRFIQPLVASYFVADSWRNHLQPDYPVSNRPVVRLGRTTWRGFLPFGYPLALQVNFLLWFLAGLPLLVRKCLALHEQMFSGQRQGAIILLRTGVSNETNIADWISRKHAGEAVSMLSLNEDAGVDLLALRHLPNLIQQYATIGQELRSSILELYRAGELSEEQLCVLVPTWLVLLSRAAPLMCAYRRWSERFLRPSSELTHLYFTMNSVVEASFMAALPEIRHACVEHGFPRRDIPPLACPQYVFGKNYSDYLKTFSYEITVEEIGLDYFAKADLGEKTRTIVVASLQDWPQWGVKRVERLFNEGLAIAKANGWRLVFRGRNFDEDSFARRLHCEWDEKSSPIRESFAECLQRLKPSMVWTTWSTAVLDAAAMGVPGVFFVDESLLDFFVPEFIGEMMIVKGQDEIKWLSLI